MWKYVDRIVLILLIFSGLNYGLWSIFEFNMIDYVFGKVWIDYVIYFAMGASAVYAIFTWKKALRDWTKR